MIVVNGQVVAQGSQFSLDDVEVVTATVDLEEVRAFRFAPSRGLQAVRTPEYRRIETSFSLSLESDDLNPDLAPSPPREIRYHLPEEEIAMGPACWLWDYLRRSKLAGFLLPLSGGIDSCATAVIVFSMCRIVMQAVKDGNEQVIMDVKRIAGAYEKEGWMPKTPEELCNNIFHTLYMGMAAQSSKETRSRAKELSKAIGSYHVDLDIDDIFNAQRNTFTKATGFEPKFKVYGGTQAENLALQNLQARTRMVTAYEFSQLLPTVRQRPNGGGLLVLASCNCDE
jgi:NAD+ synthase (glutamine-hydrolysing)